MVRSVSSFTGIITLSLLVSGIFFGVILVREEQDIRNQAKELKEHKVVVCHKAGADKWVQIEISERALQAHLDHGDIRGNCPEDKKSGSVGVGGQQGSTLVPVSLATNVTVNNSTYLPVDPTPQIRYVYVTTRFDFKIKLQGVESKKPDKSARVIMRRGEDELHVFNNVNMTSDARGIYRGTLADVRPGVFEVLIKPDGYLQRGMSNVNIKQGINSFDWSNGELLAGDFDGNNVLNAKDIAEFLSFYTDLINPAGEETKVFDVNMDMVIDSHDLDIVLSNYSSLIVEGDN
jgi:hypothetical protein